MTIDQAKAVDAMTLLENVIRGVDPKFTPPQPPGLNRALASLAPSHEHRARALAIGHSVDGLLALARRQICELANTIRIIASTAPPADANAAIITAIIALTN
jgi:hypothetical protein